MQEGCRLEGCPMEEGCSRTRGQYSRGAVQGCEGGQ